MREFKKSLKCACRGLQYMVKRERNFRIELVIAFLVLILMLVFKVKNWEAIILVLIMALVIAAELVNTVLERVVVIFLPYFYNLLER